MALASGTLAVWAILLLFVLVDRSSPTSIQGSWTCRCSGVTYALPNVTATTAVSWPVLSFPTDVFNLAPQLCANTVGREPGFGVIDPDTSDRGCLTDYRNYLYTAVAGSNPAPLWMTNGTSSCYYFSSHAVPMPIPCARVSIPVNVLCMKRTNASLCGSGPAMLNGQWTLGGNCYNLASCNSGYSAVNATVSSQCIESRWTPGTLQCPPVCCGSSLRLLHGSIFFPPQTVYQSRANLTCQPGFHLHGNDSVTCLANGLWTVPGDCVAEVVAFDAPGSGSMDTGVPTVAPTMLVSDGANGTTISLSWRGVGSSEVNGVILGYQIMYASSPSGAPMTANSTGSGTTYVLSGLTFSTAYVVTVSVITTGGVGPFSNTLAASTTQDVAFDASGSGSGSGSGSIDTGVPLQVSNVRVVMFANTLLVSANVTWTPASDIRDPIIAYTTLYTLGEQSGTLSLTGSNSTTVGPSQSSVIISGLEKEMTYSFSVLAQTLTGYGPQSSIVQNTGAALHPNQPTSIMASISGCSATVTWQYSGNRVDTFLVFAFYQTADRAKRAIAVPSNVAFLNETVAGASRMATVGGLRPSTGYAFDVVGQVTFNGYVSQSDLNINANDLSSSTTFIVPSSNDDSSSAGIIAGAVVGAAVFLTLALVLTLCRGRLRSGARRKYQVSGAISSTAVRTVTSQDKETNIDEGLYQEIDGHGIGVAASGEKTTDEANDPDANVLRAVGPGLGSPCPPDYEPLTSSTAAKRLGRSGNQSSENAYVRNPEHQDILMVVNPGLRLPHPQNYERLTRSESATRASCSRNTSAEKARNVVVSQANHYDNVPPVCDQILTSSSDGPVYANLPPKRSMYANYPATVEYDYV